MSGPPTRREALGGIAAAGAAILTPAAISPSLARAQDADDALSLERFLAEAIVLEQIAVLAYATTGGELRGSRALRRTLERFERQEQIHATALRAALDSIGIDPPNAPTAPDDAQAIEDALESDRAEELSELLGGLEALQTRADHLRYLVRLENEQLRFYLRAAPSLEAEDILRTGAEIAACEAQQIVVLRQALGSAPVDAVPELSARNRP